jgi:hypothetical protein
MKKQKENVIDQILSSAKGARKNSKSLIKKIGNLEKTIEDNKKLKEEADEEFLRNIEKFFRTRSYRYKAMFDYIGYHVIIDGILYNFDRVNMETQKITLESGYLEYLSRKNKHHSIKLSLSEFLKKADPVRSSIRTKDSFKKGDPVFISDSKFFEGFLDSGGVYINNGEGEYENFYRGEILRILENDTVIVQLCFPGIGGPMGLEVLVDLKQLRHTTSADDIFDRIRENNFEISEMNGFKIGDQIRYKNNKKHESEDEGEFYYKISDYKTFHSHTFKILGFVNDKVIVGAYTRSKENYKQLFMINDIEEIEKIDSPKKKLKK